MKNIKVVLLAAGKGTRMNSNIPKVMHKVNGVPMLQCVYNAFNLAGIKSENIISILGDRRDYIINKLNITNYALQEEQLGTAHAVKMVKPLLENYNGLVIIACGDTPLINSETIEELINIHTKSKNSVTIISTYVKNPTGYGRIIKNESGVVSKIVEEKDATIDQKLIQEINTGVYCINSDKLFEYIDCIKNENIKKEYYLTDIIYELSKCNEKISTFIIEDFEQMLGVNNRYQLSIANNLMRKRKNISLMSQGVTFINPSNTYIESNVSIGKDTIIFPNVYITGNSVIGENVEIKENCRIENSHIGDNCEIISSVIEHSKLKSNVKVGPYAHIRPDSILKENVKIGNFVEVKKSILESGVKSGHLTYLGNAKVGKNVNVGAGTITCNYDGKNKFQTKIGENSFIGSNTLFVAPVEIGKNVVTGAGSVITKKIEDGSLAVSRPKLLVKSNYKK